jgi:cytochrome o ubiquinol oxidase operon protein cyoD
MRLGTFQSYLLGFAACLLLTLAAYFIASRHLFSKMHLDLAIAAIAALQGCLFLFIYMDLGQERKPRWNMTVFLFMIGVTALIVVGSIWIMYHLNYNLMPHT